jgi:sugar-specific transcriptional regulator TrmB
MSEGAPISNPFAEMADFLVSTGRLKRVDAQIYALGLSKLTLTTSDVIDEMPEIEQTTAGDRLRRLSKLGYFDNSLPTEKNKLARQFRVIPPRRALADLIKALEKLPKILAILDEQFEKQAESPEPEDVWLTQSQEAAFAKGAVMIAGASQSLRIACNDCTWLDDIDTKEALQQAASRGVSIVVVANPDEAETKELESLGVRLIRFSDTGIPYCIIDGRTLILINKVGKLRNHYSIMTTTGGYMVSKQTRAFEVLLRRSESGSKT